MTNMDRQVADNIGAALGETKAFDPVLLRVDKLTNIADYLFICSGQSTRQVQAIADKILDYFKKNNGRLPLGAEGQNEGRWVLLDYGDLIIHVFYHPVREFYDLEGLWIEAEHIPFEAD